MTKIIGLTGSIATGKSTVARMIAEEGIPVLDLDEITHDLENHNQKVIEIIGKCFGKNVISSGKVDRNKLGKIVFSNPSKMKELVRIINPFLFKLIEKNTNGCLTVLDAPTLFENGFQIMTDNVLMVTCDPVIQMSRLQKRDNISISKANQLISAQWPQSLKKELADELIDSSNGFKDLKQQVLKWLDKLR
ncbi:dephospho-CoA kinase [Fructilactobacillus lindneri]|uniref:Dephospho-CoA kinase n=2 Tax=Fructilactobacillus lindneri TaxID=53444 RepID=A0A0R2JYE8_9LACO|nr:dephospho-CoA kinase [Fructilactobacillus lindneri]ANZ58274.1 hypothetical protein AYR60_05725 [Fructilactobacillus lindneri]ANZ59596.1 hypothetical protein AYR59_05980 [Fructilactobacillus lindneri]KRN79101.1 hypothetical protein IV52_GL000506 [Fructilactobacillus lindneri DSM 20690 = JCM 11027]POG98620.1 dephospho-CoA kinase [Fructilactobacillus lindneri]POH04008.1 dephospho-CoA kinase [Fructilactobacillus lindneri]